jgi:hypothetical protein
MRILKVFLLATLLCGVAHAQTTVASYYTWTAANAAGPVGFNAATATNGSYIYLISGPAARFTIDWTVNGTVSACTWRVEGSSDAITWTGIDATAPNADSVPCTSGNAVNISNGQFKFLRIYLVTFTGAGSVEFHYSGAR